MAATVLICSTWIPEDDILLKNSIEAGASFEALAKGAVQFSRRFTFCELRERWNSLLYDPDISTRASSRMIELELPGSNPSSKFIWSDNSKSGEVTEKRKIGSIRSQYNAMRKRLRIELLNSTDIGFLDEPNLHDCGGRAGDFQEHVTLDNRLGDSNCMLGDCISDHFGLQDSDFDILRCVFPEAVGDIDATNVVDNAGDGFQTGCQDLVEDNHSIKNVRRDSFYGFPEDIPPLIGDDGRGSFESNNDRKDASHMLTDNSFNFGKCTNANNISPSQELPNGKHFEADDSEMKRLLIFDSLNGNPHNYGSGFGEKHINSPDSDGSASFHAMGFSSPLSRLPLWKTMEDISVPAMPVHMNNGDRTQGAEEASTLPDSSEHRKNSTSGYDFVHSMPLLRDTVSGACFSSVAVPEGEFADLSDSLLNFPNEDELLFMDVDGKDKMESCYGNVDSPITCSLNDAQGGGLCNIEPSKLCDIEPSKSLVSNTCLKPLTISSPCPTESENIAYALHNDVQQSVCHSDINVASTSVLHPDSVRLNDEFSCCTLNTEDPEIPCNDDIFLLIHPTTSFASARKSITMDSIDPASSADEKDNEQGVNLLEKAKDPALSFAWLMVIGPNMPESNPVPLVGCSVKSKVSNTKCLKLLPGEADKALRDPSQCRSTHATPVTTAVGVMEEDIVKVETRVVDNTSTSREMALRAEAGSVKMALPESVVNPSISDQDESESDNGVPYYSDIEAMLLEMDLGAHDQDSYTSRQVSRYQDEDAKSTIIRLEQCARSSLQRTMSSHGALAFLYGRHLKHYIRKTEGFKPPLYSRNELGFHGGHGFAGVLLGRSTDDFDVDIDLRKEGRANKISRRQALIKLENYGSFFLKNLGKCSISVNGKAVDSGQLLHLSSSCLIEIRGMSFVFEINHKYVRRYLDNITKKNKFKSSKWSSGHEP